MRHEPLDPAWMAPARSRATWADRWRDWAGRLVADERFRRWALAFPPTRMLARRRARDLFDLVAGFVYSQVLLACVRLRLFDLLAHGPQAVEDLAPRLDLVPDRARRLLDAATALRLLARHRDGRYGLGSLGAPLVGHEALQAMILHHGSLYADLSDPVALLRSAPGGRALSGYWPYARDGSSRDLGTADVADYSALMSITQPLVAREVLDAYRVSGHRCLLDVGGGEGRFLEAASQRAPHLRLMLFDLPAVAERARTRLGAAGLGERVAVSGGDFLHDPLPQGADLISLVRVVHDHDDDAALALLRAVRVALPAQGCVLLAEPMAGTPGAQAMGAAYFGFYLLAMGSGRPRTEAELSGLLRAAGFHRIRSLPTRLPMQTSVLVASASTTAAT